MDFKIHLTESGKLKAEISRLQRLFETSGNEEVLEQIAILTQKLIQEHCPPERFVWNEAKPILDKFSIYQKYL